MALVVPNPEPVEEVEARRCLLGELSWSAAKSLPLEEFGKVDTKDRLMSVLTKGLMFDYEDLSEEEAKELAEVIDVVYGTIDWTIRRELDPVWRAQHTDGVAFVVATPRRVSDAKAMIEFNKSLKPLVASNPEPARRRPLAEIRSGAANSIRLEETGKADTKDRLMSLLTREVMLIGEVSEETAKELAELIHVVYDITDAVDALLVTAEQVEQAKTMLKFDKSLKP